MSKEGLRTDEKKIEKAAQEWFRHSSDRLKKKQEKIGAGGSNN